MNSHKDQSAVKFGAPSKESKESQAPTHEPMDTSEPQQAHHLADQKSFDAACPVESRVFGELPKFGAMEAYKNFNVKK